jgi:geranylgeranylglycerol-phosphate geranylgeranyltransferase
MRRVAALVRWQNALIAAAGVLVGALWARSSISSATGWALLAAVGFTTFANADNDVHDERIDRVAHPQRPLPRGDLSRRTARLIALAGALAAIAGAAATRVPALLAFAPVILAGMLAYNRWLSRAGIAGNVVVATIASLPFVYGAASVGALRAGVALAAIAAPLHLAREVAKDVDDARGDAPFRRTLATSAPGWLARSAVLLALAIFVYGAVQLGTIAPRLPMLLLPAFVLCALAARRVVAGRSGAPLLFKLAMIVSMAALLLARRPLPTE